MTMIKKVKKMVYRDYFSRKIKIRKRLGLSLLLRYGNYIDRKLILHEYYEKRQIETIVTLINNNNVQKFMDIGANFGLYSLTVARKCPKVSKIISFEPDRDNYNNLCGNIFVNEFSHKIQTYSLGLSNRSAMVKFLKNSGKSSGTSRISETAPDSTKTERYSEVEIEVATLDSLAAGCSGEIVAMKIDVEGHELMVLEGAKNLIANNKCIMQIEILQDCQEIVDKICKEYALTFYGRIDNDCYFANYGCHAEAVVFD